ncbi:GNAT family N-acetyltransferase [bacterium]|nr:GNAT family N-acetyltransferase [bacterium]
MTTMETERLVIRNFDVDDWHELQEMITQYQSSDYAVYDHEWPTSTEKIKGIVEWFAGGDSYLAVCLKNTRKLIGYIALNQGKKEDCLEFNLGYCFNFDYHGKGYATESCRALVEYAFNQLGADRIVTGTAAANYPSCLLLKRLGMRKTGENTGSFRKTPDGKLIEFVGFSFALSRDEWLELHKM